MTKSTDLQNTVDTELGNLISGIARIVEHQQQGESRAAYGKQQLQLLSQQLSERFGKGFDERNLRNMRQFYLTFPNWNAVRSNLSWTHYRTLLKVITPTYMGAADAKA